MADAQKELGFDGPFPGIQSAVGVQQMSFTGFQEVANVLFRKAQAQVCPGLTPAPFAQVAEDGSQEPIVGVFDFFNILGNRISGIHTPTQMFVWGGNSWLPVNGSGLTGPITNLFSYTVVNSKLLFSQGIDPVQAYDGQTNAYAIVSPNATAALYLGSLQERLICAGTIESGTYAPQRVRWTIAGDVTNWVGFGSGAADLNNDLGPITGWIKLYQQGYVFQQWGIVQQVPTGNALVPFSFQPLSAHTKGLYYPHSLAGFGEDLAVYVGKDDIYIFDGSVSTPIGERPLDGSNARIGARTRILADLLTANANTVFGYILPSTNGRDYKSYWLFVTGVATWIYNFDEGNWTRITWGSRIPQVSNQFFKGTELTIADLQGPISAQTWVPSNLEGQISATDTYLIGFTDGSSGFFDFSQPSEQDWTLRTGRLDFGDTRHSKNIRHVRLVFDDILDHDVVYTVCITAEDGQKEEHLVLSQAGNGYQVVPFKIPGFFLTLEIFGSAGQDINFAEIKIGFDIGAEARPQGKFDADAIAA